MMSFRAGSGRFLGILDQALSSLSNLAVTLVAARALDPTSFGGFALVLVVYMFALGGSRCLVTEPLLVRGRTTRHEDVNGAMGALVVFGFAVGLPCAALGLLVGGAVGPALIGLAVFLPLILLQDGLRYIAFSVERPTRALFVDSLWVVFEALAVAALLLAGSRGAAPFVVAWGLAAAVAAVMGCALFQVVPSVRNATRWVKRNVDLGVPFLLEFLASGGAAYVVLWLVGVLSDLASVGAVRLAATVFGPINVLYMGIYLTVVPAGVRYASTNRPRLRQLMLAVSMALVGVAAVCTVVARLLPAGLGRSLLGDPWTTARPLLVPLGIATCAGGVMAGATAGLRALAAARESLRTRVITIPLAVVLPLAGTVARGAMGYCVGLAVASWLTAALWWRSFGTALRAVPRHDAGESSSRRERSRSVTKTTSRRSRSRAASS